MTEANGHGVDISVSIVNWHTREDLLECLGSFVPPEARRQPEGSSFAVNGLTCEVIVVDNASGDGSVEDTRAQFPVVRLLAQERNLGFGRGHNKAISVARGRYILLLNPDTIIGERSLPDLVACAHSRPEAGILGPRILNPDGSVQYSARSFPTLAAGFFRNSILGRLFPRNRYTREYLQSDWDHHDTREVDWVSGAAMLIRREALKDLTGLDEDYYMYVEDVDICWRARKAGWTVLFCAESEIKHKKARASDLAPNRMIYHHHRSMYLFFRKHYLADAGVLQQIIVPAGLFVRASYFITRNKMAKWLGLRR